jgi:hypothetical protein
MKSQRAGNHSGRTNGQEADAWELTEDAGSGCAQPTTSKQSVQSSLTAIAKCGNHEAHGTVLPHLINLTAEIAETAENSLVFE